jgi:hypothetical protein
LDGALEIGAKLSPGALEAAAEAGEEDGTEEVEHMTVVGKGEAVASRKAAVVVDRKAADRVIGKASWEVDKVNMEVYMAVVEGCGGVASAGNTHMA